MPTEIDTKGLVSKYIQRPTTGARLSGQSNTADETQALLEAVATTFLLYPEIVFGFVLKLKNTCQQLVASDIELLDYMLDTLDELNNPNTPVEDTSSLVSAQTALIELGKAGKLDTNSSAYSRYSRSVSDFLNKHLAPSLKLHNKGKFERTGIEARSDLYNAIITYTQAHQVVNQRLEWLVQSVSDFLSVDLTKIVSASTLSKIRSSLQQIQKGAELGNLSKTVMALELLAGSSALASVSNKKKLLDPIVSTGYLPSGRTISVRSEAAPAVAASSVNPPYDLSGRAYISINAASITTNLTFPEIGYEGSAFVWGQPLTVTAVVPPNSRLYVRVKPYTPPTPSTPDILYADITSGPPDMQTILVDINTQLGAYLTAVDIGDGSLLLIGNPGIASVEIVSEGPGSVEISLIEGVYSTTYTSARYSCHAELGLSPCTSAAIGMFDTDFLVMAINAKAAGVIASKTDTGRIQIRSIDTGPSAYLTLSGPSLPSLGLPTSGTVSPEVLELVENGVVIDPSSVGIVPGSLVTATAFSRTATSIRSRIGTSPGLQFSTELPPIAETSVTISSPAVSSIPILLSQISPFLAKFPSDALLLRQILPPLLARPTTAQIEDARNAFLEIRGRMVAAYSILQSFVLRSDQLESGTVLRTLLSALEERGLDTALQMLSLCRFSDFFTLPKEQASSGSLLLNTMETYARTDLPTSTSENDQPDAPQPVADNL